MIPILCLLKWTSNFKQNILYNIANFNLGRDKIGGNVIELIEVDSAVDDLVLEKLTQIEDIVQVKKLNF